jgi:hypothetical protein
MTVDVAPEEPVAEDRERREHAHEQREPERATELLRALGEARREAKPEHHRGQRDGQQEHEEGRRLRHRREADVMIGREEMPSRVGREAEPERARGRHHHAHDRDGARVVEDELTDAPKPRGRREHRHEEERAPDDRSRHGEQAREAPREREALPRGRAQAVHEPRHDAREHARPERGRRAREHLTERVLGHRPLNSGARFWKKAIMPSMQSSE